MEEVLSPPFELLPCPNASFHRSIGVNNFLANLAAF
jgi:hypothetical protein